MFDRERYIIFESDLNIQETIDHLNACGIGFKQLEGCYAGKTSPNFIINEKEYHQCMQLIEDQDTVLILSHKQGCGMRIAHIQFTKTGSRATLGYLEQVTEKEAKSAGDYTFDPLTGFYFIAR